MTFGSVFGRTFSPTFQPSSQAASGAAPAWTPNSISGCVLWYDFSDADTMFTDAGTTKVSSDGDAIYQINDKSTSGINATQATANNRPAYKTGAQNSLSAGYAAIKNKYYMDHPYPLGTATDFTVFLHAELTELFNYTGILGWRFAAGYTMNTTANGALQVGTDVANRINVAAGLSANTNYLFVLKKSGSSSGNFSAKVNNGTPYVNTGKTATSPNSGTMQLFATGHGSTPVDVMAGYIYEYIVYNSALSDTDRGTVETYLNNKWAIY